MLVARRQGKSHRPTSTSSSRRRTDSPPTAVVRHRSSHRYPASPHMPLHPPRSLRDDEARTRRRCKRCTEHPARSVVIVHTAPDLWNQAAAGQERTNQTPCFLPAGRLLPSSRQFPPHSLPWIAATRASRMYRNDRPHKVRDISQWPWGKPPTGVRLLVYTGKLRKP